MHRHSSEEPRLEALMGAYQAGRLDAFEGLYAALAPALHGYLGSLARDAARTSDLVQEAFLQLHRSRHTWRSPLPVRPWAFAIARHVWLMDQRSRRRRGAVEAPSSEELPELPVPPEVERLAGRHELSRALGHLPQERREALVLHHVLGLSFREIGELMGIRETAARLRASRAMAELRQHLGQPQVESTHA